MIWFLIYRFGRRLRIRHLKGLVSGVYLWTSMADLYFQQKKSIAMKQPHHHLVCWWFTVMNPDQPLLMASIATSHPFEAFRHHICFKKCWNLKPKALATASCPHCGNRSPGEPQPQRRVGQQCPACAGGSSPCRHGVQHNTSRCWWWFMGVVNQGLAMVNHDY